MPYVMKLYPIGIQNFEKLRREGYHYVDKTGLMYRLVTTGNYYFLSRPRRFGKSLLISTLEAYFEGKKELFDGLAIASLEKTWKKYPVFHFDLSVGRTDFDGGLDAILDWNLSKYEAIYGRTDTEYINEIRFANLISNAHRQSGEMVVILIDEYDKPVLRSIENPVLCHENSRKLQSFFSVTKSQDKHIKFVMLTGLTAIHNESIFGGFNNFCNISDYPAYADLCGLTEDELHRDFSDDIKSLAEKNNQSDEEVRNMLKSEYGGYCFSHGCQDNYNLSDLMTIFASLQYGSHWFETGTPYSLITLLKKSKYDLASIGNKEILTDSLYEPYDEFHPVPALYQSGYLTIKGYDAEFGLYRLGFPNQEVEDAFEMLIQTVSMS